MSGSGYVAGQRLDGAGDRDHDDEHRLHDPRACVRGPQREHQRGPEQDRHRYLLPRARVGDPLDRERRDDRDQH